MGPGWIVIQQREYGKESFNWNWDTSKSSFGNFSSNYFLRLEKINRPTKDQHHELIVYGYLLIITTLPWRWGEGDKYRLLNLGSTSNERVYGDRMRSHGIYGTKYMVLKTAGSSCRLELVAYYYFLKTIKIMKRWRGN